MIGHAIPGIVEPTLEEYTLLGDAASKTDGRIYKSSLSPSEVENEYSGVPDDRWAFTTHTTPLNYAAISSLAAASRVLRGFDDQRAAKCLQTAVRVWDEEHRQSPSLFKSFNTTGGELKNEETKAAVELDELDRNLSANPYGVPITTGTWGGSGAASGMAVHMYYLHQAFPDIVGTEYTLRGLDSVLGTHPVSSVSYVSTVGTQSKLVAYGNNRSDYTFIPGGMIPGVVIVQPDYPELKDDWPFLWFENEYVVDTATSFIVAANAANALTKQYK